MIWTTPSRISSHDVDYNGAVTVTAIMRYMQESANIQVREMGPSNESLRENGQAFILSRFGLEIHSPLFAYDKIEAKTWGAGNKRLLFHRCFTIEKAGEMVARAHATMGLMDISTRKLLSSDCYHAGFTYEDDFQTPIDESMTLPRSVGDMDYLGDYKVTYQVCDMNRHMNNTRYADMLLGFADMEKKWVTHYAIRFAKEAPMGETVKVYGQFSGNTLLFRTIRSDGELNAEAKVVLADL